MAIIFIMHNNRLSDTTQPLPFYVDTNQTFVLLVAFLPQISE